MNDDINRQIDDAEARILEYGDFMILRQHGEGEDVMFEPLPARIYRDSNVVIFSFGTENYWVKIEELDKWLNAAEEEDE